MSTIHFKCQHVYFCCRSKMADAVNERIVAQGNRIREMKSGRADKASIKAEVDVLLALKAEYKGITGTEWKPSGGGGGGGDKKQQGKGKECTPPPVAVPYSGGGLTAAEKDEMTAAAAEALDLKIQHVGGLIRKLKNEKADKDTVKAEVEVLLFLKNCYKGGIHTCLPLSFLLWKAKVTQCTKPLEIGYKVHGFVQPK